MKVPRLNLGVLVRVPGAEKYWGAIVITRVDHKAQKFWVQLKGFSDQTAAAMNLLLGLHWNKMDFSEYDPLPVMDTFLRAIAEWDYHYRASDDPRWYEEGKEQEEALIALLKALPVDVQHQLQKIVEIVVMSAQPQK